MNRNLLYLGVLLTLLLICGVFAAVRPLRGATPSSPAQPVARLWR